jgi:hypothetical protein
VLITLVVSTGMEKEGNNGPGGQKDEIEELRMGEQHS